MRGNINTLQRWGLTATCTWGLIDNLTYNYGASGYNPKNQLQSVTESSDLTKGFKTVANGSTYTYDTNGNMTADPNKSITNIVYNHLNLPTTITFTNNRTISFLYDAGGNKLRKTVVDNGTMQYIQDYVGGIEYRTNSSNVIALEAIYHAEGRITTISGTLKYEYAMKDHLGNTRLMFCDKNANGVITQSGAPESSEVTQENHYYGFGMAMENVWYNTPSVSDNKYTYNGKEYNDDFGLGWNDYGARMYDPAVGRFFVQDRFSEKYKNMPAYQYAANNPILNIDIHGDSVWQTSKQTVDKNGKSTINTTIHVRGKVLDLSGVKEGGGGCSSAKDGRATLAKGINDKLNAQKSSSTDAAGNTTNVSFDAQYSVANSMAEVSESDHLMVVVDDVTGRADPNLGGGKAGGIAEFDSKIAYISNEGPMNHMIDKAVHEFGHNMGLEHVSNGNGNIMSYDDNRGGFNTSQMMQMREAAYSGSPNNNPNRQLSPMTTNNYFYNTSSNIHPWAKNTSEGQVIPRIRTNK